MVEYNISVVCFMLNFFLLSFPVNVFFMEFIPCRRCGSNKMLPAGFLKKLITNEDGTTSEVVAECKCHKEWRVNNTKRRLFENNGFNSSLFDYDISEYIGAEDSDVKKGRVSKYIEQFLNNNQKVRSAIVYFYGPNGTQKTTVSHYIGSQLVKNGLDCRYISFKNLINILWKSQRDETLSDDVERYTNCDLLIIDESFDSTKAHIWKSGAQIGVIDDFIRKRLILQKGIVFISNIQIDNISTDLFGKSLVDLIKRETHLKNSVLTFEDKYVSLIGLPPEDLF